jgi:hypothetical protein
MEALVSSAKFIAAFMAAILGLIAVLSDFRTDNGKLSRAGVLTLIGIALSGLLSIAILVGEDSMAKHEARRQAHALSKRIEWQSQVLGDIQRTVHAFDRLNIGLRIQLPANHSDLSQYVPLWDVQREKLGKAGGDPAQSSGNDYTYLIEPRSGKVGDTLRLVIDQKSSFFPSFGTPAGKLLQPVSVMHVTRSGADALRIRSLPSLPFATKETREKYSMMELLLPALRDKDRGDYIKAGKNLLEVEYDKDRGRVVVNFSIPDATRIYDNGEITSIPDFSRKTLLLVTPYKQESGARVSEISITPRKGDENNWGRRKLIGAAQLETIVLDGKLAVMYRFGERDFQRNSPFDAVAD